MPNVEGDNEYKVPDGNGYKPDDRKESPDEKESGRFLEFLSRLLSDAIQPVKSTEAMKLL